MPAKLLRKPISDQSVAEFASWVVAATVHAALLHYKVPQTIVRLFERGRRRTAEAYELLRVQIWACIDVRDLEDSEMLTRRSLAGIILMPVRMLRSVVVTNTIQRVETRGYAWWVFKARSGTTLSGSFEAAGSDNNDIQAYVGSKDEVLNALNGHGGSVLYQSGKRTSGKFSGQIPEPGEYALALSNRFSFISPKNVRVRADLGLGLWQRR